MLVLSALNVVMRNGAERAVPSVPGGRFLPLNANKHFVLEKLLKKDLKKKKTISIER